MYSEIKILPGLKNQDNKAISRSFILRTYTHLVREGLCLVKYTPAQLINVCISRGHHGGDVRRVRMVLSAARVELLSGSSGSKVRKFSNFDPNQTLPTAGCRARRTDPPELRVLSRSS